MTVLATHKQARLAGGSAIVSRVLIAETDDAGRATVITEHLTLQAPDVLALREAVEVIRRQARERADRDGTSLQIRSTRPRPPALRVQDDRTGSRHQSRRRSRARVRPQRGPLPRRLS